MWAAPDGSQKSCQALHLTAASTALYKALGALRGSRASFRELLHFVCEALLQLAIPSPENRVRCKSSGP